VAELGADVVTDPGRAFDEGPFDVILEPVGAPNLPANLDALATGGRLMVIGVGAGATIELDLRVPVAATFALEDAQQAYDRFTAGGKLGKLVLVT
jgi:NADPH:quinone reductase